MAGTSESLMGGINFPDRVLPRSIYSLLTAVTWEQLVLSTFLVVAGFVANQLSNRAIKRAAKKRGGDRHATRTAERFTGYIIYSITFLLVLGALGVPLSSIGAAVGLIGLGVSFALRDVIANFISGMFILINKPFRIGDQIEVDGYEGTVRDIQMRASRVEAYDGRMLIVPNSKLYNNIVVNNTDGRERRFEVLVGVSFESDIGEARDQAEKALRDAKNVRERPEPQVMVKELGDSSVELRLWGWTDPRNADQLEAASEVVELTKQRFDQEGIEIPFPIRTVISAEDRKEGGATD